MFLSEVKSSTSLQNKNLHLAEYNQNTSQTWLLQTNLSSSDDSTIVIFVELGGNRFVWILRGCI